MVEQDRSYFTKRAAEESAAADEAMCPRAAEAHRELAARYALLAHGLPDQSVATSA